MDNTTAQTLRDAAKVHVEEVLSLLVELPTAAVNASILAAGNVQHVTKRLGNIAPHPESFALTIDRGDLPTRHAEAIAANLSHFTASDLFGAFNGIAEAQARRREALTAERGRLRAGRFLRQATARAIAADHIHDALDIMQELPIAASAFEGVLEAICLASGIAIVAEGFAALDPRDRAVEAESLGFDVASLRARTSANAVRLAVWRELWLDAVWVAISDDTDAGAEVVGPDLGGTRRSRAIAAQRAAEVREVKKRDDADEARRRADRAARLAKYEHQQEASRATARDEARRHRRAMGYGTLDAKVTSDSKPQKDEDGFGLSY
ncbi:hypothetical protein QN367_06845 [Cryobacterium sp. RTS3]|uniref:hypothetical protein n=1 Tax=Cryobacterium sp. RTS3 TaxID=3048643 RepID=UPI002B236261|nr:hypothetical protein [Cryobacterium sp. RTS3]MEA9998810.1 hypothetical protein [Cryobacterium sp. RTS3]